MSDKPVLKLDWCSHAAATYAVEHWHYSRRMPKSKLAKIGVWENGMFIGVVIFGVGATADLVKRFGLMSTEGCELVRVALTVHSTPVSRILAIAIRLLVAAFRNLRLIVSFADPEHYHLGIIYQAGGWIYMGMTTSSPEYIVQGKRWHGRALRHEKPVHMTTKQAAAALDPHFSIIAGSSKYRYIYPLDAAMRRQILPLAQPYPKRAVSTAASAPASQAGEGRSSLTTALRSAER